MKELIKKIVQVSYESKEGHIPSSLSILDLLYVFYNNFHEDKLILSKGHAALGLYVVLEHFGLLEEEIFNFCKLNSLIGGHPTHKIKSVVASTGSLGHGLPIGLGMALGYKIQDIDRKVFVIIGDGECNEGTIWESALLAAHHRLNNLYCILDHNRSGDRALNLGNIFDKFTAFGWEVLDINGHDHEHILRAFNLISLKPKLIIANTIKGNGVKIMENNPEWHHKFPNDEELTKIMSSL